MGITGIWQWVIVLIIVLLLFGTKRLRNLGGDLGSAIKSFRKGVATDESQDKQPAAQQESAPEDTKQAGKSDS